MHSPVDVLLRADRLSNSALAVGTDMRPKRELNEDTADGFVLVELFNNFDNLSHFGLLRDLHVLELDADLLGRLGLHAHIDRRVRALASLDDGKARTEAGVLRLQRLNLPRDLLTDRSGPSRSI